MLAIIALPNYVINRLSQFLFLIVISYPLLSILDIFPHQGMIDIVSSFDTNKAESLNFRFFNENILLKHAEEKLLFGWGGWGRGRLVNSVTDGYWIIILGKSGIFGFGAIFSLAGLAMWLGIKTSSHLKNKAEKSLQAAHVLLVAIIMVDQIPNASMNGYLWLLVGSLLGRANSLRRAHNIIPDLKGANI